MDSAGNYQNILHTFFILAASLVPLGIAAVYIFSGKIQRIK
jgi:hypothetical protein